MAVVVCVVTATLIGRAFVAIQPDLWDGQMFSYLGQKWLEGQIPYVDLWDNKPPGLFALLAAVFSVFGRDYYAVAILEGLVLLGTSALAYDFLRRAGAGAAAGGLAAACVAVTCSMNRWSPGGLYTEVYALLPMMASMYCFARARSGLRARWLFAAGLSAGIAAIFNPKGLSPLIAQAAFLGLAALRRQSGPGVLLRAWLAQALGVVVAWIPLAAYFAAKGGAAELLNASLLYNFAYGSNSRPSTITNALAMIERLRLFAPPLVAACAAIAIGARRWWKRPAGQDATDSAWVAILLGLWLLVDLAGVQAGGRNYYHYYLLPALSSSVAAGYLLSLFPRPQGAADRVIPVLASVILVPMLLGTLADARALRWHWTDPGPADPIVQAADWIREVATPGETLFAWDYAPALFSMTDLDAVTAPMDAHHIYDSPAAEARFGPVIMDDLQASPPDFVADRTADPQSRSAGDPWYARFRAFVDARYVEVQRIGPYAIFRPRETPAATSAVED